LKETGEGLSFERFLKIFISKKNEVWLPSGTRYSVPSDEFVEDLNVFLQVLDRCRVLCVKDGERRGGCTIIDVGTAGLNKAADKDDFEKGICIFQELECGSSLNELCSKGVKIVLWDSFKMFVELVSED